MNPVWIIARTELRRDFVSPIGYIVLSLFAVLAGWFFFDHVNQFNALVTAYQRNLEPDALNQINLNRFVMMPLFNELLMLLGIFLPAMTMRLIAEEKKQKTLELLFTAPLRTADIIAGKYLSALLFLSIMLTLTLTYPVILFVYGSPGPDLMPIITGYLGLFLVGACVLAVGLFASSITENQIVAFVLAISIAMLFSIIHLPADAVGGPVGELLRFLSLRRQFSGFAAGLLDTRAIVYYLSFIFTWLFLTHRAMEGLRVR